MRRAFALMLLLPSLAYAQIELPDVTRNPVRFTGEIGSEGELYSVSGREQRRPSSTGRLFIRSQLELFSAVTVKFDVLYSTDHSSDVMLGSTGRQSLNQIGIAPHWRWGKAYAGSFYDSYSSLTYDGLSLRGGGFNITPGPFRLGAFTGRAQSAVAGGPVDGAYRRQMSGGKIGLARRYQNGEPAFVDVVIVRTADDPASLRAPAASDEGESLLGNPYAVTPEENVVAAAITRIPLFQQRVMLSGEVAASIYSRDRRAPEISEELLDGYAELMRSFITPRLSTYGDIAHNAELELRNIALPGSTTPAPRILSGAVGYRYVGAGFVSLGAASLPADQLAFNARAALRFRTWTASVQGMQQENNVLGQKLATTSRNRLAVTTSFRPARALSSALRFSMNTMRNDIADPERSVDYTSYIAGVTQSFNLPHGGLLRAVALSYSYQQAGDDNPLRTSSHLRAHDANIRTTLDFSRSFSLIPAVGFAQTQQGDRAAELRHTYALAAQHRTPGGRLSTTASVSNSRLHAGGSLQAAFSSRFRLTAADMVTLSLRSNHVSGLETADGEFREQTVSIQWSRAIR
ncbi:MAG TPA: hypothetical protein VFZ04_22985 [Longimicrobiales bacterium]